MLTSTAANLLTNKVNKAFDNIGKTNGTSMPHSDRNTDPIAWELHIARHLAKLAEGRKEQATKLAISAGVIPDYVSKPHTPGCNECVYVGDVVQITLQVRNGRVIMDSDKFIAALLDAGVDYDLVSSLSEKYMKRSAPSHIFTTSIAAG